MFKLPTCVPFSSGVCPSGYYLFLKPGAQAAHLVTAADPTASTRGPLWHLLFAFARQINEVFAFLWRSGTFQKVSEGGFAGESELC